MKKCTVASITTIDGSSVSISGYVLGQGEKAVYIQGGMHGGEVTYWIFHHLAEKLQGKTLKKQIVFVPICNPFSWQQRSYFYTCGKFSFTDGKDWLWSFPGSKLGSPMQRVAAQLFDLASSYQLSVDLHTSRKSVPFGIFSSAKYENEIQALGLPFNFVSTYGDSPEQFQKGIASLSYAMSMTGKRGFTLECGSHDDYNQDYVELVVNALLNLLKHEGVIDGDIQRSGKVTTFSDAQFSRYTSPVTGFVKYLKEPGQQYKKGDILFTVYDATNISELVDVRAITDGTLLKISPTHIAQAGDVMLEVIVYAK